MSEFEEGLATGLLLGDGGSGTIIQKTFTQNGTYHAIADAVDGYDPVIVDVPIASKSITKNGIYYAVDDNLRGFDPVNVNVPMYWTFQPGETIPPSMVETGHPIEEDAPPSSEDVPYPTPEDPDRYITPKITFWNKNEPVIDPQGQPMSSFGAYLTDTQTGEILDQISWGHPWNSGEEFIIVSWNYANGILNVEFTYDWYDPGVTHWDHLSLGVNVGNYTASSDSGQNTTTVYGE